MKLTNLFSLSNLPLPFAAPKFHLGNNHNHPIKRALVTLIEFIDEEGEIVTATTGKDFAAPTSDATTITLIGTSTVTSVNDVFITCDLDNYKGPNEEFKDGIIKCTVFLSGQDVIPIDWISLGSWVSIMAFDCSTTTECNNEFYCS